MRKQVLFILIFALGVLFAADAQSDHSSILFKHHSTLATPELALNTKFHPNISQISMADLNIGGEGAGNRRGGRYEDAVHKRNAGIGLTAAGGATLTGGVILMAVGIRGLHNDDIFGSNYNGNGYNPAVHLVEAVFGTILAIAGTAMTIPGAIILAKGQRQMKKYKASQTVN